MLKIDRDLNRFRNIVKGRVRRDLRKYMSSSEMIGKKGKEMVSIPIHQIGIPRIRYGKNESGMLAVRGSSLVNGCQYKKQDCRRGFSSC